MATFQSTLPLRGATRLEARRLLICTDFNPRSPCGERLGNQQTMQLADIFQSTLPLRGATAPYAVLECSCLFQSTLPLRGATITLPSWQTATAIFQSTLPLRGATGTTSTF